MAYGVRFCFVCILLTLLLKLLIRNYLKPKDSLDIKINDIFVANGLDVKYFQRQILVCLEGSFSNLVCHQP